MLLHTVMMLHVKRIYNMIRTLIHIMLYIIITIGLVYAGLSTQLHSKRLLSQYHTKPLTLDNIISTWQLEREEMPIIRVCNREYKQ